MCVGGCACGCVVHLCIAVFIFLLLFSVFFLLVFTLYISQCTYISLKIANFLLLVIKMSSGKVMSKYIMLTVKK